MSSPTGSVTLPQLAPMRAGTVSAIDWHLLADSEARRLREFGLDEGVEVELLTRSGLLGGPMAARIGRMTVALRRHVGDAIHVTQVS